MTVQFERIYSEYAIMVATFLPPVDPVNDAYLFEQPFNELLESEDGTIYRIIDFTQTNLKFSDVVLGMGTDLYMRNPRVVTFVVGNDEMLRMGAEAASQDQYGGRAVRVFLSVEEAVATIEDNQIR